MMIIIIIKNIYTTQWKYLTLKSINNSLFWVIFHPFFPLTHLDTIDHWSLFEVNIAAFVDYLDPKIVKPQLVFPCLNKLIWHLLLLFCTVVGAALSLLSFYYPLSDRYWHLSILSDDNVEISLLPYGLCYIVIFHLWFYHQWLWLFSILFTKEYHQWPR